MRRQRNYRKRTCEEEEEDDRNEKEGKRDQVKPVKDDKEDGDDTKDDDEVKRMASLEAVRALQRMRGKKIYRDAQLEVMRHAEEVSAFDKGVETVDGRKIGLDKRDGGDAGQQGPRDITDHSQRMEEYISKRLQAEREGKSTDSEKDKISSSEKTKESVIEEKKEEKQEDDVNQMMSFARVTEVSLPDTFRQSNITATEEATRNYFQQRREEREKLASDPLASFGRVPSSSSPSVTNKRQHESSQATDSIVFERFLKKTRWGDQ